MEQSQAMQQNVSQGGPSELNITESPSHSPAAQNINTHVEDQSISMTRVTAAMKDCLFDPVYLARYEHLDTVDSSGELDAQDSDLTDSSVSLPSNSENSSSSSEDEVQEHETGYEEVSPPGDPNSLSDTHLAVIIAFNSKHKLKGSIVNDLFQMISILLGGDNAVMQCSPKHVQKFLQTVKYPVEKNYYCSKCRVSRNN